MIVTKNAIYLHVPKTAGTWLKTTMVDIAETITTHTFPNGSNKRDYLFSFVRNPWAWYVSSFNASVYGSTSNPAIQNNIMFHAFNSTPTVQDYIYNMSYPTAEFKRKLCMMYKIRNNLEFSPPAMMELAETWQYADCGWFQHICNSFTQDCDYVGTQENVVDDAIHMIKLSGDWSVELEKRMRDQSPINTGHKQIPYQTYYTPELARAVADSCAGLITEFGYVFE